MANKNCMVRALFDRVPKICNNNNLFHKQVASIEKVMTWNSYSHCILIIKRLKTRKILRTLLN